MPNTISLQNLYRTTITSATAIPASGDFEFDVAVAPNTKNGFLIMGSENVSTRNVFYFHDVIGSTIYVRGINRITAAAIASPTGYSVKMNDLAEIFNFFGNNISSCFYVEKLGGLNIKVWGGFVQYNNLVQTVADTILTLANNTTNYINYDPSANTISTSITPGTNVKAIVTTLSGVWTATTYNTTKESYLDARVVTGNIDGGNAEFLI